MTNTVFYTIIVTSTIAITGCGSGDFTSSGDYEKVNETGGSIGDGDTGSSNGDGDGDGDGDTGGISGDGDGDIVNTGGTSGDGDTGGYNGDGDTVTGGTSSGGSNIGGSGGSDICIPETCEEIGERLSGVPGHAACGIVTNNCGTQVDCSNSTCGRYQDCGTQIWDENNPGKLTAEAVYTSLGITELYDRFINENYPNICGEDCVNISEIVNPNFCPYNYPITIICADGVVPDDDCYELSTMSPFCCSSSGKYQLYN